MLLFFRFNDWGNFCDFICPCTNLSQTSCSKQSRSLGAAQPFGCGQCKTHCPKGRVKSRKRLCDGSAARHRTQCRVSGIRHIFDGYNLMTSLGEPEIARICLTHSFPVKNIRTYAGKIDCTQVQLTFLQDFLNSRPYDDYDRLIQLCDAISLPNGACILEKRLVDVALRHGVTEHSIDKWKAFMQVKKHFDQLCGCSIYSLLPNVLENSSVDLI